MGQRYGFKCGRRRYDVEVGGGQAFGMRAYNVTVQCLNCKAFFDVLARLMSRKAGEKLFEEKPIACSKQKTHKVREWVIADPCPKCGGGMEMGGPMCLWD